MKFKFEMGKIYEVEYLDHYDSEKQTPIEAVDYGDLKLKAYGKYIGENKRYVVFCWNYENEISNNNDNMHILKNDITNVKELK